jgi:hypothetical protein
MILKNNKIGITLYVIISFILGFTACESTGTQGKGLLSSSGRSGEMLVVCQSSAWKGALGDSLRSMFMSSLECLPQNEPYFTLSHISNDKFNAIYQKQRNILYVDINSSYTEAKVTVSKDKWALPQLIITLFVSDEKAAIALAATHKDKIMSLFLDSEIKRFQRAQFAQQDKSIDKKLKKSYKLSMIVPQGFIFAVKNENFCWMRKETKYWGQSILIYTEDYTDTSMFSNTYIVALRNKMTKQYVFGSLDSSYMIVDEKFIPTKSDFYDFNGMYGVKTQGIWKMVGDYMGGAFVNYTLLDTKRNRVISLDGFLYAPTDDKRDLLRQIEAVLLSTKLENET